MRALSSRNLRGTSNGRGSDNSSPPRFHSAGARYDVLDRAGEGTLFVTYRVRDKNSDRVLALKALKNAYSKHTQFAPVLAAGATKLLELPYANENAHVAQLFEIGEEEGTTFLVTQWLAGQSLEARLRRAPFGRIESLTGARQIAHGLKLLHENRIVHGDLRPRQVLGAADGLLQITDAGMSDAFAAAGLSIAEVLPDSIYYLAPERISPHLQGDAPATIAGDLYALGAILYRMLSGRVPFAGPSPVAVAMRHRHDEPLAPSRYNLQCPPDLEAIALRLLAKNPQERFASAQEVLEALEPQPQIVTSIVTSIAPPSVAPPIAPPIVENADDKITAAQTALDTTTNAATTSVATAFDTTSSTRCDAATSASAATSAAVPTSQNTASAHLASAPTASAPNLFPADLTISALAAAPLSQIAAAPVATVPVATVAASSVAVSATANASKSATSSTRSTAAAAKSSAPVLSRDDEKKARKKQKRREFWGAFWALLWVFIGLGLFVGIFYGAYYFWDQGKPKSVSVPSYIGKSQARATADLKQRGLVLGDVSEVFDTKRAAGTVINGSPRPGREVKIGRQVSLIVSRGAEQIAMPDFSDLNVTQVRQVLARSGMKLGNITEIYNERVAKGYVCGQFPAPGEAFSRSEAINLVISRGAQPVDNTKPTGDLLPPPPPLSTGTSTEDNPLTTSNGTPAADGNDAPLVSRTALVRVPVPAKAPGNANERDVKIEVRDANGTNVVYEGPHLPGELIDEYVRVTRPQGSTATISIYIDGQLQKQQKV